MSAPPRQAMTTRSRQHTQPGAYAETATETAAHQSRMVADCDSRTRPPLPPASTSAGIQASSSGGVATRARPTEQLPSAFFLHARGRYAACSDAHSAAAGCLLDCVWCRAGAGGRMVCREEAAAPSRQLPCGWRLTPVAALLTVTHDCCGSLMHVAHAHARPHAAASSGAHPPPPGAAPPYMPPAPYVLVGRVRCGSHGQREWSDNTGAPPRRRLSSPL